MIVHAINWSFLKDLSVYVLRAFTGIAERCECSTVCMRDHVSRVVGHARGRDLTGLKNDKKIDFVNFTLMATENYWFNCNEIYNQ